MSRTRLHAALRTLFRIQKLPHPKHLKCKFIRTSAHSRGLYGCESSPVDGSMLRQYTSCIMKVVGTDNQIHVQ
eukprot:2294630-Karenia_brevis.AAC.1